MASIGKWAVGALLAALVLGGGDAHAHWSTSGSGDGSAKAESLLTVTISALAGGDAPETTLVPGVSADVIVRVDNPNTFTVGVYSVEQNGTIVPDSDHSGCSPTGVTFTAPASPPEPAITLDPGETLVHLPDAVSMDDTSASACQGATFEIPVTLTVRR
ncbi:MAG: hypothetical protein WD602_05245 [Actinomycetota bacterium]